MSSRAAGLRDPPETPVSRVQGVSENQAAAIVSILRAAADLLKAGGT